MSYGVALRNGVPFTLGTIAALCVNATSQAFNPLVLWPDGIATPGMWISPRDLTSQWADYTGTTPVVTPGTVADSVNPVGLALDIRAGATVLTDPGNHMLQSTSAARPLLSARRNLLTYTEDFSNAVWGVLFGLEKTPNYALAPDGSMTACRLYAPSVDGALYGHGLMNASLTRGAWMKSNTASNYSVTLITTVCTVTPTWTFFEAPFNGNEYLWNMSVPGGGDISIWHPQTERGTTATPYQSVPGDGSTYATGFPIAQLYDGVDDGMATAAFAAGTLIAGMDCMIAVRRDSANHVILGPYNATGDLTKYIGNAELNYYSACYTGVGSPTVWVDNVQLTNGWASELHTAVTVGDWHILEFRGLDLSAWTGLGSGGFGYTGYNLNGPRGDILLYPSTASTEDKDAARQWLADYYGVTLP
jgi:hypothetical protein